MLAQYSMNPAETYFYKQDGTYHKFTGHWTVKFPLPKEHELLCKCKFKYLKGPQWQRGNTLVSHH